MAHNDVRSGLTRTFVDKLRELRKLLSVAFDTIVVIQNDCSNCDESLSKKTTKNWPVDMCC